MDKGLLSSALDWATHPYHDDTPMLEWAMGLVVILAVAFLWSTVVKLVGE